MNPAAEDKPIAVNLEEPGKDEPAVAEIDEQTNRRLLRKIDWKLMPVLCLTYALQYYDKAILSQAAIFGLREELDLQTGLRYSWVSLVFYFGHLIGTYPIAALTQRVPTRILCSGLCFLWAVIMLSTVACTSYGGLLANRSALGLVESGISPIFMLVVGLWYTHPEQVMRSSLWYSFSGGSLLVSPLINYGLGHISGGALSTWQYMYLIAGLVTLAWAVVLWWVFPGTPQDASGFSDEERRLVLERVRVNNAGVQSRRFKKGQLWEALTDYQFWGIIILSLVSCSGAGVVNTFAAIVFNGMGFSTFTSLLLNLPIGALAVFCVLGSGYVGRRVPNSRLNLIAASSLPVILGCALLWQLPDSARAGRIVGFYLTTFFSSAWVQCIGLGTSNVAGYTKKTAYAGGTFIGYSLGNILGPLLFHESYAPRYDQSFIGIMICFVVCFVTACVLRLLLAGENKRREETFGDAGVGHALEDLTDKENKSFRYHL